MDSTKQLLHIIEGIQTGYYYHLPCVIRPQVDSSDGPSVHTWHSYTSRVTTCNRIPHPGSMRKLTGLSLGQIKFLLTQHLKIDKI